MRHSFQPRLVNDPFPRERGHLTAREAGEPAKRAGLKEFALFHFYPRYRHREHQLRDEALAAFPG